MAENKANGQNEHWKVADVMRNAICKATCEASEDAMSEASWYWTLEYYLFTSHEDSVYNVTKSAIYLLGDHD